jgi:phosphoglycolate phosphatase
MPADMQFSPNLTGTTVVFDLDGTLVDTAPDLLRALNLTLDLEGLPHAPTQAMRLLVGQGARAMIERAAGMAGARFSQPRLDQLTEAFVAYYRQDIAAESLPFLGVEETLTILAEAGARLAVCTNKRTDLSIQLLRALDLELRFSAIVGADSVTHKKPHPDHFRETVARAGGVVRASVMVGDSAPDVASAKAAGAPAVVVTFGYSEVPVEKLGADAILEDYADAVPILTRLLRPAG